MGRAGDVGGDMERAATMNKPLIIATVIFVTVVVVFGTLGGLYLQAMMTVQDWQRAQDARAAVTRCMGHGEAELLLCMDRAGFGLTWQGRVNVVDVEEILGYEN